MQYTNEWILALITADLLSMRFVCLHVLDANLILHMQFVLHSLYFTEYYCLSRC